MNEQEDVVRLENAIKCVNSQLIHAQRSLTKKDEMIPLLNAILCSTEIIRLACDDKIPRTDGKKYAKSIKYCAIAIKQILLAVEEEKK